MNLDIQKSTSRGNGTMSSFSQDNFMDNMRADLQRQVSQQHGRDEIARLEREKALDQLKNIKPPAINAFLSSSDELKRQVTESIKSGEDKFYPVGSEIAGEAFALAGNNIWLPFDVVPAFFDDRNRSFVVQLAISELVANYVKGLP